MQTILVKPCKPFYSDHANQQVITISKIFSIMSNYHRIMALAAAASALAGWAASPQATFDSFEYNGHDAVYEQQLPDEHYYFNPILPGWYSDPAICTNGQGDYFLVTSTFTYFPGVPIFHSRDLMNWKQIGYVLSRESQLLNMEGQGVSGGIFAPAIAYNPANKTYYMITTNVGYGNFLVKTQDPWGEWSDPIRLPEVAGIDPSMFFDEDGKAYIVNNDDAPDNKPEYPGHRTVRIQEYDTVNDCTVGERHIIVNKGVKPEDKPIWCEGPHMYKINGEYYLMTAEGGTGDGHSEVIYRGNSPFGPFTPWDKNPMLTQRTLASDRQNPVTCAGHADIIEGPNGEWWGVFLACRPLENGCENLGRETYLMPVRWTNDGWPYFTADGEHISLVNRKHDAVRGETATFGNFSQKLDFNADKLPMDWMTLRASATDLYKVGGGQLTLACTDNTTKDKSTPAYVSRRVQHHCFDASTHMNFKPAGQERAGLLIFKDETHQYLLARDKADQVSVLKVSENGEECIGSVPVKGESVDLKVEGAGTEFAFYCSTDGGANWQPVATGVDASYTSTAKTGGFTGTMVGLYASAKPF